MSLQRVTTTTGHVASADELWQPGSSQLLGVHGLWGSGFFILEAKASGVWALPWLREVLGVSGRMLGFWVLQIERTESKVRLIFALS